VGRPLEIVVEMAQLLVGIATAGEIDNSVSNRSLIFTFL